MLFGWLACAKRPLKWHEIQGAKSLDLENQKVDMKMKGFVCDAKEICGSLIEDHQDGSIKFIHITARWFVRPSIVCQVSNKNAGSLPRANTSTLKASSSGTSTCTTNM